MARLELAGKPLVSSDIGWITTPYHLYLIYTNDSGKEYILRAGPSNTYELTFDAKDKDFWIFNALLGDISVTGADKLIPYTAATNTQHKDFDFDGTHIRQTLLTGSEATVAFDKCRLEGTKVKGARVDYSLFWGNSNSVIARALKATGIDFALPKDTSGKTICAPGFSNSKLGISNFDRIGQECMDFIGTATNFVKRLPKALATEWDKAKEDRSRFLESNFSPLELDRAGRLSRLSIETLTALIDKKSGISQNKKNKLKKEGISLLKAEKALDKKAYAIVIKKYLKRIENRYVKKTSLMFEQAVTLTKRISDESITAKQQAINREKVQAKVRFLRAGTRMFGQLSRLAGEDSLAQQVAGIGEATASILESGHQLAMGAVDGITSATLTFNIIGAIGSIVGLFKKKRRSGGGLQKALAAISKQIQDLAIYVRDFKNGVDIRLNQLERLMIKQHAGVLNEFAKLADGLANIDAVVERLDKKLTALGIHMNQGHCELVSTDFRVSRDHFDVLLESTRAGEYLPSVSLEEIKKYFKDAFRSAFSQGISTATNPLCNGALLKGKPDPESIKVAGIEFNIASLSQFAYEYKKSSLDARKLAKKTPNLSMMHEGLEFFRVIRDALYMIPPFNQLPMELGYIKKFEDGVKEYTEFLKYLRNNKEFLPDLVNQIKQNIKDLTADIKKAEQGFLKKHIGTVKQQLIQSDAHYLKDLKAPLRWYTLNTREHNHWDIAKREMSGASYRAYLRDKLSAVDSFNFA